jgi:hypothetical protein
MDLSLRHLGIAIGSNYLWGVDRGMALPPWVFPTGARHSQPAWCCATPEDPPPSGSGWDEWEMGTARDEGR